MNIKIYKHSMCLFRLAVCAIAAIAFVSVAQAQDNIRQQQQGLTKKDVQLWTANGNVVPVCWETPGYAREKAIVRAAVINTWERFSSVRFTGWAFCPTGGIGGSASAKHVRMRVRDQDGSNAGASGSARLGMGALSSANDNNPGVNFSFNPDGTADKGRVEYTAVHEFGHVLGFVHEQDTPGNVHGAAYCKSPGNEPNATSLTDYDPDSIMNYCNKDGNMNGNLTDKDIKGLQAVYGYPPKALGKVKLPTTSTPGPPTSICESAQRARARNSPAAPGLEAQCLAIVNALAAKGEAIANQVLPGSSSPAPEPRTRTSRVVTPIDKLSAPDKSYRDLKNAGTVPTSNEIRCRGGRDGLTFTVENSRQSTTGETITYLLTFNNGSQAAGLRGTGLKPGQCSWADRPMNQSLLIRFETPANAQLKQKLHGSAVDTSPTAAERYPDSRTIPAYLSNPNHYWSFFGAGPVNNFFVASGHGYWKPGLDFVKPSKTTDKNPYDQLLRTNKPE